MIRDLTKEEQKQLLELLFVCVLYVNVIEEPNNPFVKFLGQTNKEKAYKVLLEVLTTLENLIPLTYDLTVDMAGDESVKEDLSKYE